MAALGVLALLVLLLAAYRPAAAADSLRCLSRNEQRAAIADGKAMPLATVRRALRQKMPGDLVRARLCHQSERLTYLLTVLARDGTVLHASIDAANGATVGEH